MILRDCWPNSFNIRLLEHTARKWDILVMKMCEDYDSKYPLFVKLQALAFAFLINFRCHLFYFCIAITKSYIAGPWVVVALKDVGAFEPPTELCDCCKSKGVTLGC